MPDDGVSVVPTPTGTEEPKKMAADLPDAVASQLMTETVGNLQATNAHSRNIATMATGVLQAAMARNFDELGSVESRATSGVMATPIASPTTQAGP